MVLLATDREDVTLVHASNTLITSSHLEPRQSKTRTGELVNAVFASKPHPRMLAFAFKVNAIGKATIITVVDNYAPFMIHPSRDDFFYGLSNTGYIWQLPGQYFQPVIEPDETIVEYISNSAVPLSECCRMDISFVDALKYGLQLFFLKPGKNSKEDELLFWQNLAKISTRNVLALKELLIASTDHYNIELYESGSDVSYVDFTNNEIANRGQIDPALADLLAIKSPNMNLAKEHDHGFQTQDIA
jgi:hypothetical protein